MDAPSRVKSVIWEVGGYLGDWVGEGLSVPGNADFYKVVFEPLPAHVEKLRARFSGRPDVEVRAYGLFESSGMRPLYPNADSTSVHREYGEAVVCEFRDVVAEVDAELAPDIQMQLNVEGDEYAILKRLIDSGRIKRFKAMQVQFHDWVPEARVLRDELRERLESTHRESPFIPWVWERWQRRA